MPRTPLLLAALLLAAACAPAQEPPAEPPAGPAVATPPPPAARPPADPERAAALARWRANGPASYTYTLEMQCLCIHRGIYAVEVRDREIVSVTDPRSGAPSPPSRVEWILTVDWLFDAMEQAASLGTPVRAVFDPALGFPTEAEIGLLADDSGTLYRIEGLRAR